MGGAAHVLGEERWEGQGRAERDDPKHLKFSLAHQTAQCRIRPPRRRMIHGIPGSFGQSTFLWVCSRDPPPPPAPRHSKTTQPPPHPPPPNLSFRWERNKVFVLWRRLPPAASSPLPLSPKTRTVPSPPLPSQRSLTCIHTLRSQISSTAFIQVSTIPNTMSSLSTPILAAEQSPPTAPARSGFTFGCSAYSSTEHSRQGGSTSPFSLGAGTGVAAPAPAFGSAVSNNTGPYILSGFGRLASSTAPGRNLFMEAVASKNNLLTAEEQPSPDSDVLVAPLPTTDSSSGPPPPLPSPPAAAAAVDTPSDEYSTLVDSLHSAGIDKLVKILRNEFSRGLTNMKCCDIRLETRKNTIVAKILEHVKIGDQDKLMASIMATYFAPKEKVPPGEALWITSFSVGEIVLVDAGRKYRSFWQKGVVDKVNNTSVTVKPYKYREIGDWTALRNQTFGKIRLIWLDTFEAKKVVKSRRNITKKGDSIYYDSQFIEGLERVDYGS